MKLACVQASVVFGDPDANSAAALRQLETLAGIGVELAVFPEAYLTGYCVDSMEAAREIAIPRYHPSLASIHEASEKLNILCVVGFAEIDGQTVFNAAALIEPGREPRFYRKTHLPELGLDKHVQAGDSLEVFETCLGRIGILICFDQRQPEAARVLALKGAELIVLPTNWPEGAENSADIMSIARAAENRVFYAACNRVGREHGFRFIGRSKIISPNGKVLAGAGETEECIVADVDLSEARNKRAVVIPGKYEWTVFDSRRPELYGILTDATEKPGES